MFGTSGVRGPVGDEVTAELALSIARAVGTDADSVVVGRDARDSGEALQSAVVAGLLETGTDVVDVGTAATPTLARAIGTQDADAGIVVTASHNPPPDNGIKLWTPTGQAFSTVQQEGIADRIRQEAYDLAAWDEQGTYRAWDGAKRAHCDALVSAGRWPASPSESAEAGGPEGSTADGSAAADGSTASADGSTAAALSDLSVVVDVGNGMGGVAADALHDLGATVETLNAQKDGAFPGRPSEPTAETCASLAKTVAAVDADLGIAHDGDADRMMAVTGEGEFVPGDMLLAIFGTEVAGEGDRVAAPVDTSLAVDDALAEVGASVVRTRVGDVYVAERAREPDVAFGGEPSGAWIFPEETLCPDGPLAAVKLATLAASEPLADRLSAVEQYPIRRDSVETDAKAAAMEEVRAAVLERYDDVSTLDGVRVETADGWFLIRPSGTQPLVRLTAEARDADNADELLAAARSLVDGAIGGGR